MGGVARDHEGMEEMQLIAPPVGFVAPARVTAAPRVSQRHPALFPVAVRANRAKRRLAWLRSTTPWARARESSSLAHRVKAHNSLLMRELSEAEMHLQRNKVTNLRLAAARVDRILIRPGETFSFNKFVGNCTRRKGYVEGMRLSNGEARRRASVAGSASSPTCCTGWSLHTPLTVSNAPSTASTRSPTRVGCCPGASAPRSSTTTSTSRSATTPTRPSRSSWRWATATSRANCAPTRRCAHSYKVFARDEQFLESGDDVFRRNEIWRTVIDRRTGQAVAEELLKRNCALVRYHPEDVPVIDVSLAPGCRGPRRRPVTSCAGDC